MVFIKGIQDESLKYNEEGQAVLETAIVLPVILMLLMIGITVCLLIYSQIIVTMSASNGARYGASIWTDDSMTRPEKEEEIKNVALKMVKDSLTGKERRYDISENDGMLKVSVEYDFDIFLPFVGLVIENETVTIQHTSEYYVGGN